MPYTAHDARTRLAAFLVLVEQRPRFQRALYRTREFSIEDGLDGFTVYFNGLGIGPIEPNSVPAALEALRDVDAIADLYDGDESAARAGTLDVL